MRVCLVFGDPAGRSGQVVFSQVLKQSALVRRGALCGVRAGGAVVWGAALSVSDFPEGVEEPVQVLVDERHPSVEVEAVLRAAGWLPYGVPLPTPRHSPFLTDLTVLVDGGTQAWAKRIWLAYPLAATQRLGLSVGESPVVVRCLWPASAPGRSPEALADTEAVGVQWREDGWLPVGAPPALEELPDLVRIADALEARVEAVQGRSLLTGVVLHRPELLVPGDVEGRLPADVALAAGWALQEAGLGHLLPPGFLPAA